MGMLGTAGRILAERYHVSYPKLIQTLSPPGILSNGIALFFASAIAAVWGKRIGIVIGAFVIWINMFAGYFANSIIYYRNLGIVSGIFGAPKELLLGPIITELIFVHQRGRLMALSALVGIIGGDASHVIAGNIIAKLGVKYLYLISFSVMTPFLVAIYFLVWETTYPRASPFALTPEDSDDDKDSSQSSTPTRVNSSSGDIEDLKKGGVVTEERIENIERAETTDSLDEEPKKYQPPTEGTLEDPKFTVAQQLRLYRGRVTNRGFFRSLVQPFPYMIFPSVIFSTVINGAYITWSHMSGIISHQIMLYEPYNLKPDQAAYISLPGSLVSLVFSICSGMASDKLIQWMAHRNNGVYEPEYRLLLMIPAVIFSTTGFLVLGPLYHMKAPLWKLVICQQFFHMAGPFAGSATITYIFDTMQHTSTEAFVATSLFKHVFSFLTTQYVPTWFAKVGPLHAYRVLAVLNVSFALLAIPMYVWGKRLRGAVARNKLLQKAADSAKGAKKPQ